MTKDHWKAATFLSVAALIVTLAASHYTRRTLETELAEARRQLLEQPAAELELEPEPLPAPVAPRVRYQPATAPLAEGERCIGGTAFRKDASGAWTSLERSCS